MARFIFSANSAAVPRGHSALYKPVKPLKPVTMRLHNRTRGGLWPHTRQPAPERATSAGGFGSGAVLFGAVVSFKSKRKEKMHCMIYFKASKLLQTAML